MRLFQNQRHNQDSFKRLIHRLSGMSEADLYKVNQLLDVLFDSTSQTTSEERKTPKVIPKEPTLDETITEAKNKLNTEQLEKRIEEFRQAKNG
ncbi:TPA: hypothetical protein U1628_001488 [Streptococcus suis]|nr:hypothetical protein [Streptococcus suis]NQO91579.1 hypothetical protein [Streptococcus suis]NQP02238.1 hypothetical protein [Streptococcus suis]HEL2483174.1 hypothetical protein [Streptococcus suis]HEL2484059.1 hypothetical protein [Streptococcus suis]